MQIEKIAWSIIRIINYEFEKKKIKVWIKFVEIDCMIGAPAEELRVFEAHKLLFIRTCKSWMRDCNSRGVAFGLLLNFDCFTLQ